MKLKRKIEILTDAEVQKLLRACPTTCDTGVRNRALISLLYRCGMRVNEALALRAQDIDSAAGTVRIHNGKGGKSRTVGLDSGAMAMILLWIARRQLRGLKNSGRLFSTLQGTPLYSSYIRTLLPRIAEIAGIDKRVHAHGLRHTHACQLAAEGVPLNVIQKQLGHSNVATTSQYLDHIQPTEVIETMKAREWAVAK